MSKAPTRDKMIIYDDSISEAAKYILNTTKKTELILADYLAALDQARNDAVLSGKTAEALTCYMIRAAELGGLIAEFGEQANQLILDFQTTLDEIDKKLY